VVSQSCPGLAPHKGHTNVIGLVGSFAGGLGFVTRTMMPQEAKPWKLKLWTLIDLPGSPSQAGSPSAGI